MSDSIRSVRLRGIQAKEAVELQVRQEPLQGEPLLRSRILENGVALTNQLADVAAEPSSPVFRIESELPASPQAEGAANSSREVSKARADELMARPSRENKEVILQQKAEAHEAAAANKPPAAQPVQVGYDAPTWSAIQASNANLTTQVLEQENGQKIELFTGISGK